MLSGAGHPHAALWFFHYIFLVDQSRLFFNVKKLLTLYSALLYDNNIICQGIIMPQVKRQKLADAVLDEVRNMIRRGELNEGDKLPNQIDLAAQLGVSRTSLREAISMLSLLGAVEQRPRYGTVLISKYNVLNSKVVTPPLMSDSKAALELIEARKAVEIAAAELAAINATHDQIEKLKTIVSDMESSLKKGKSQKYIELDIAFHLQVAKSANNRFITYFYGNMQGYIEQYIQECLNLLPNMQKISLNFHRKITKAIKDRDPKSAVSAMKDHITDIKINYEKYCNLIYKGAEEKKFLRNTASIRHVFKN